MGLDITVYSGPLTLVDESQIDPNDEDQRYNEGWLRVNDYNGFHRQGSLEVGKLYQTTDAYHFTAASYGGFARYREQLCMMVLGVTLDSVWANPIRYRTAPFFEQINFGDNEDTIGPEACAELAADYAEWLPKVEAMAEEDDAEETQYFVEKFKRWHDAFQTAASTQGAIDYH